MKILNPGILLMLLVALLQSLFIVIVKLTNQSVSTAVTVLAYYIIPLLFFVPIILKSRRSLLDTNYVIFFFVRGFLAFTAVFCFFYAARNIHLGAAAILFNTAPVCMPLLSRLFLQEYTTKQVYLGIFISLVGVVIVMHPGLDGLYSICSLIGLASGVLMAITQVMLRFLIQKKIPATQIVFYLYFTCAIWAVIFIILNMLFFNNYGDMYISGNKGDIYVLSLLLLLGGLSLLAQRVLTHAFHFMPAAKLVPVLYASVPISSLFGWVGWKQSLDFYFYIGSIFVFIGVLLIAFDRKNNSV